MCAFQLALSGKRSSIHFIVSAPLRQSQAERLAIASGSLAVLTDQQARVAQVGMRWNFEVGRGGHAFEHASGEVELGAVAGTEKAALPAFAQPALGARRQLLRRRTAQVRTDADQHEVLRLD